MCQLFRVALVIQMSGVPFSGEEASARFVRFAETTNLDQRVIFLSNPIRRSAALIVRIWRAPVRDKDSRAGPDCFIAEQAITLPAEPISIVQGSNEALIVEIFEEIVLVEESVIQSPGQLASDLGFAACRKARHNDADLQSASSASRTGHCVVPDPVCPSSRTADSGSVVEDRVRRGDL